MLMQAHAGLVVPEAGSESHAMSTPFPAQDAALTAGVATPTGPNKVPPDPVFPILPVLCSCPPMHAPPKHLSGLVTLAALLPYLLFVQTPSVSNLNAKCTCMPQ